MSDTCTGHTNASHLIFRGENYTQWRRRVILRLDSKQLGHTLKEIPENLTKNKKIDRYNEDKTALNIIVSLMHDDVLDLLEEFKTPKDIIDQLDALYEPKNVNSAIGIRLQLGNCRLEGEKDVRSYINEMISGFNRLDRADGRKASETEKMSWIINGLPGSYANVSASAMGLAETSQLTVGTLRNLLINEETRRGILLKRNPKPAALTSTSSPKSSTEDVCKYCKDPSHTVDECEKLKKKLESECHKCGKKGHFAKQCPEKDNSSDEDEKEKSPNKKKGEKSPFVSNVVFKPRDYLDGLIDM